MSKEEDSLNINLSAWVEKAKSNLEKYRVRQVVEILMHAIGSTKNLKKNLYLKGGTLMALAHNSERMTGDVDYSWFGEPFSTSIADSIVESLNMALMRTIVELGYLDLICKIQAVHKEPNKWQSKISYPALNLSIAYALKGSAQEKALEAGNCTNTVWVEISFNEPLENVQQLHLDKTDVSIQAYAPVEIIAEKMRALFQQTQRKHTRHRRQDIYDITLLIERFAFDEGEKESLLNTLRIKANSRDVVIAKESFADMAVKEAAKKEWETMRLEIEEPLPAFEECYQKVQEFYESLPWL